MSDPWQPGTFITGRSFWYGRVFAAWPFAVVEDRGDVIAACMPPGTVWKRPTDLEGNDMHRTIAQSADRLYCVAQEL